MKSFPKSLFGFIFIALIPLVGYSQVVEDDAVISSAPEGSTSDFTLTLSQTTAAGGGTESGLFGFDIDDLGNDQFQFDAFGIAEQYGIYSVEPGDAVTPGFVNSSTPFASNFTESDGILTLVAGESLFLGYWDDRSLLIDNPVGSSNTADADDNFGWLELGRSDLGELQILGGATAIGSGIVAGTTTTIAVPEPSTTMLLGLLGMSAFFPPTKIASDW